MIKTTDVVDKRSNLIYVVPQNGEVKNLPEAHVDFVKHFQESDQKEDFIKTGKQYIFFVKEQDELEKMRVAGYNIRQKLDKKEDKLTLIGQGEASLALAEGFMLSNYQFLKYFKDKAEKAYALKELKLCSDVEAARVSQLNHVIQAVYWARDMVNEPVCYLTAEKLAEEMQRLGQETNIKVTVFDKAKIEELKMGGLLAVNRGSVLPPTFTVMEYKPENPVNKKPIVLVGKGLVFDTGGLSLKPTQGSMDSMKSDMGGAACMIGAIYAAALNKLDVHIISLIPSTDNRPGQNAYTPGDIITMFDGTTIEVMNTDAEGRMILADAIAYADKYDPEVIIDAATLTGAALVVAGNQAACIMGNAEQKL
ncbi:MAG: leucyl aminopeptidase family protein, partial [Bacteroides sp.]